jgi:hypothetical protein
MSQDNNQNYYGAIIELNTPSSDPIIIKDPVRANVDKSILNY